MPAITISARLDEGRMRIFPDRSDDLAQFVAHLAKIHSVDDLARHVVAFSSIDDLLERGGAFHRGPHREEVVFANEDDRQLEEPGEVERLVKAALVDRAIAKEAERDPVFLAIFGRESHPGGERDVCADDGVAAIHVVGLVKIMHRTTKAAGAAGHFAEELSHAGVGARATSEGVRVIPVGGDEVIVRTSGGDGPGHDRFLPDVKMAEAADLLGLILLAGPLLETTDEQHGREHLDLVALLRLRHLD